MTSFKFKELVLFTHHVKNMYLLW